MDSLETSAWCRAFVASFPVGQRCDVQVHLRTHRLATSLWVKGQLQETVDLLTKPLLHFKQHLPKDPLTGESQYACSVSEIALLDASLATADVMTRIVAPKRRAALMHTAQTGLGLMARGFGAEHVLVRRAMGTAQQLLRQCPEVTVALTPER